MSAYLCAWVSVHLCQHETIGSLQKTSNVSLCLPLTVRMALVIVHWLSQQDCLSSIFKRFLGPNFLFHHKCTGIISNYLTENLGIPSKAFCLTTNITSESHLHFNFQNLISMKYKMENISVPWLCHLHVHGNNYKESD